MFEFEGAAAVNRVPTYAVYSPVTPADQVIEGGLLAIATMVIDSVATLDVAVEFVPVIPTTEEPNVVGFPEIIPVTEFSVRPAGNEPEEIAHVLTAPPVLVGARIWVGTPTVLSTLALL